MDLGFGLFFFDFGFIVRVSICQKNVICQSNVTLDSPSLTGRYVETIGRGRENACRRCVRRIAIVRGLRQCLLTRWP
jgi:hypothetical protein